MRHAGPDALGATWLFNDDSLLRTGQLGKEALRCNWLVYISGYRVAGRQFEEARADHLIRGWCLPANGLPRTRSQGEQMRRPGQCLTIAEEAVARNRSAIRRDHL
jgi:hypothetical protein